MTDEEFKTWTRHTAENLIAQRDDALVQASEAESLKADRDAVVQERDALLAKVESMKAHPDVVAAEKAKTIQDAQTMLAESLEKKRQAEEILAKAEEPVKT